MGRRLFPGPPGDPTDEGTFGGRRMGLQAPGVDVAVDLAGGGRIASFVVDGHELLVTEGFGPIALAGTRGSGDVRRRWAVPAAGANPARSNWSSTPRRCTGETNPGSRRAS